MAVKKQEVVNLSKFNLILIVLCLVGMGLGAYATKTTYEIEAYGMENPSVCSINEWINCEAAHSSSYAFLLGIPVGGWGLLLYAWLLVLAFVAFQAKEIKKKRAALVLGAILSFCAVLFSLYKATHLIKLGVLCIVCVGMYTVNILLLIFFVIAATKGISANILSLDKEFFSNLFSKNGGSNLHPQTPLYAITGLAIMGLGFMGVTNYGKDNFGIKDFNLDRISRSFWSQPASNLVVPEHAPYWGNPDAKVQIAEFSDFECPGCKQAANHMRAYLYEFKDDVNFRYINYPLAEDVNPSLGRTIHPNATLAAKAALCAHDRDDFWSFHDGIFEKQSTLGARVINELVTDRGWDISEFNSCLNDPATHAKVVADVNAGIAAQVRSTPSIYVNGRLLQQGSLAPVLRRIVSEAIERSE